MHFWQLPLGNQLGRYGQLTYHAELIAIESKYMVDDTFLDFDCIIYFRMSVTQYAELDGAQNNLMLLVHMLAVA